MKRLFPLFLLFPAVLIGQTQHDRIRSRGASTFDQYSNTQVTVITGATPSVAGGNIFKTANGGAVTITNFLNGVDSQLITIICGDGNTIIQNNANIAVTGGTNFSCSVNVALSFVYRADTGVWVENGGTGGGGGGGSPGAPAQSLQCNNGSGGFVACNAADDNTTFKINENTRFSGPNPYVDATFFGVRALSSQTTIPAVPGITGTINSGSNALTVSTSSCGGQTGSVCFKNGDGIVVFGAGAVNSLSTPSPPTVTPALASAGIATGFTATGPTGATTYNYKIRACRTGGGCTSASGAGTTATGPATLGSVTNAITSMSRAGQIVTVTTTSAHTLATGAQVEISGTGSASWNGMFIVSGSADNTHFTYNSNLDTASGAPTSISGGTANYWPAVHVSWPQVSGTYIYYVYSDRGSPGTYHLVGFSRPDAAYGVGGNPRTWDDFGAGDATVEFWVPTNDATTASNDSLVTTITSGAGTTSLTLAANAVSTVSGATTLFDNTPTILTAQNSAGGLLYFPAGGTYIINSYCPLRSQGIFTVSLAGALYLNATLEPSVRFLGGITPVNANPPQFVYEGQNLVFINRAAVGLYFNNYNSGMIRGVQFSILNKGTRGIYLLGSPITLENYGIAQAASDTTGIGLEIGNIGATQDSFDIHLRNGGMVGTQSLTLNAPIFFCNGCGITEVTNLNLSGGTIAFQSGNAGSNGEWYISFGRIQAGNNPAIEVWGNSGSTRVEKFDQDTMGHSLIANLNTAAPGQNVYIANAGPPSSQMPYVTGAPWASVIGAPNGVNANLSIIGGGVIQTSGTGTGIQAIGTSALGYQMPTPAAPTVVVGGSGSCVSNCVAAGTYFYYISANDTAGRYTLSSPASNAAVTDGTQTITVNWTPVNGQYTTNLGRGPTSAGGNFNATLGSGTNGTSRVDFGSNFYSVSGTAVTSANSEGMSSNGTYVSSLNVVNGGFKDTLSGTLTANRVQTIPDVTGYIPVTSYLNSGYDNFNRANGAIGANWTGVLGGFNVASNVLAGTGGTNTAFWNQGSFSSNQFAQTTLTTFNGTTDFTGPAVFVSAGPNHYACVENTTSMIFQKNIAGTVTNVTTTGITGAVGDVVRAEIQNGSVRCYQNGILISTTADASLTSGSPGLFQFGTTARQDNWSGGNLHPIAQLDIEQDWTQPQHFLSSISLGAETLTASPRSPLHALLPGALTAAWTGETFTLDKAITVTRVQVQLRTAPSGCGTNAIVRLTDGSSPVNLTLTALANDSGAIAQNYAAAAALTIVVQTPAATCTISPGDANVVVQYKMQ